LTTVRLIGPGRAGRSLALALEKAGWGVSGVLGRGDDPAEAASGVDLLVIATPDHAVAEVSRAVRPGPAVVAHMSGSLGLDALAPHRRRAALHPLVPLPDPEVGWRRLAGAYFAVAGDPLAAAMVEALGGRAIEVDDASRAAYHAAACIAANHLVALMGQVERVGGAAGVPLEAFLALAGAALDDVAALGPAAALPGPVRRNDRATLARHRAALDPSELAAYDAMVGLAERLARPGGTAPGAAVLVDTVAPFSATLERHRRQGATVGLVPTMGYLHAGHLSLIEAARRQCDVVAVTVFVNPLQFDSDEDLARYPRDPGGDRAAAGAAGADYVFMPAEGEMYPTAPLTTVSVGALGRVLEGAHRPGHLEGVAMVVAKLFAMAGRCRAYFGEKDYQQLVLVRRLVADLSLPVEVVGCPTVREPDGLALSSRNVRLSADERAAASVLHRALLAGREAVAAGERRPSAVASAMAAVAGGEPRVELEYAEAVRALDLSVPDELAGDVRLLVAARVGPVRLIDNLGAQAPVSDPDLVPVPAPKGTRCDAA
jgi:pantoate--beta-alanine ligase